MTNIRDLFDSIADRYDMVNGIISCRYSNVWLKHLARSVAHGLPSISNPSVLDLCCGTGAATATLLKTFNIPPRITCVDFSPKMLLLAQKRLPASVTFQLADASLLPYADASFDTVYMSFGYRNLVDKTKALREISRVLKPGGHLFILELTKPQSWIVSKVHSLILHYIVPLLGGLIVKKSDPYRYLAESIDQFSLDLTRDELRKTGFRIQKEEVFSLGCCSLLTSSTNPEHPYTQL